MYKDHICQRVIFRTSKARGSTPRCGRRLSGLCTRSTTAKDGMRAWTGRQSAPSCLCTSYKLTDLLYREARITRRHDENVVRHEAAKTPEHIQCTCAAQTVGSMDRVSHWNTVRGRPSAGVSACICQWDCSLRYNRDRVCRLALYTVKLRSYSNCFSVSDI